MTSQLQLGVIYLRKKQTEGHYRINLSCAI